MLLLLLLLLLLVMGQAHLVTYARTKASVWMVGAAPPAAL
jgi:hypothetical protein